MTTMRARKQTFKYSPIILALLGISFATHAQTVCNSLSDSVTMCDLGTIRGDNNKYSYARAVSADGSTVIGDSEADNGNTHAYVWRVGDVKMTGLGTLRSDNTGYSVARAVSADGSTVVGDADTDTGQPQAYVWRTGDVKMTSLGTLRSDNTGYSFANAVSADGSTIVGEAETDTRQPQAYVWRTGDARMTGLGTLRSDNIGNSYAHAVSADGSTVVGEADTDDGNTHAFVWRTGDAKMTGLGTLRSDNSGDSFARAVSADGSTVIGDSQTDGSRIQAFVWQTGDMKVTSLGTLKSDNTGYSSAYGVSADGSTVVGEAETDDNFNQAFVWHTGDVKVTGLGTLRSDNTGYSTARAISADGSTVVGRAQTDTGQYQAYVWHTGDVKMTGLGTLRSDNTGYSTAHAVSADGSTVVGEAETDDGPNRAFVWRKISRGDGGNGEGQIQDLNNLINSYAELSDQTEQSIRSQQRAIAYNLDQTCFADQAGGNCFKSSVMLSQTPSDRGNGYFGIGRNTLTTGTLTYGRGITNQLTLGASVTAYANSLKNSSVDLGTGWGAGLFAQYSQDGKNHTGWQAGAGMMYTSQNMDITRGYGFANVQYGQGKKELQTIALRTSIGYGVELSNAWLLTPQAKLTYYHTSRGSYMERSHGLVFDTYYDKLTDNSTIISLGADIQRPFGSHSRVLIGAGVDIDLDVKEVSVSGISNVFTLGDGIKRFNLTSNLDRNQTRPYIQAGYSYNLSSDKGTIGIGSRLSMPEYGSKGVQYTVGLSYTLNF